MFSRIVCAAVLLALIPGTAAAQRRHIIIDTDVGPDDLMAIAFLTGRADVQIDAIIVETGLATQNTGAQNVLRLLHLAGADSVPVFTGERRPLQATRPFPKAWIGDAEKQGAAAAPAAPRNPERTSGVDYLARAISTHGSKVELLLLGPLTNVALAIRKAGSGHVEPLRTVVMGGAVDVPGNLPAPEFKTSNTTAEWNFYSDPLAAREVIASPLRIELIALDATSHVRIDTCFMRLVKGGSPTSRRQYVSRILDSAREWIVRGDEYAWDPLAAVALVDSAVVQFAAINAMVDTADPTEGRTHRAVNGHRISLATSADRLRFEHTFDAALGPHARPPGACR